MTEASKNDEIIMYTQRIEITVGSFRSQNTFSELLLSNSIFPTAKVLSIEFFSIFHASIVDLSFTNQNKIDFAETIELSGAIICISKLYNYLYEMTFKLTIRTDDRYTCTQVLTRTLAYLAISNYTQTHTYTCTQTDTHIL